MRRNWNKSKRTLLFLHTSTLPQPSEGDRIRAEPALGQRQRGRGGLTGFTPVEFCFYDFISNLTRPKYRLFVLESKETREQENPLTGPEATLTSGTLPSIESQSYLLDWLGVFRCKLLRKRLRALLKKRAHSQMPGWTLEHPGNAALQTLTTT